MARPSNTTYRREPLWRAAMLHRISGVALACFLPLHFLVLGLAIRGESELDGFLRWTHNPLVKIAETVLVLLLAVHLLGGLRLLVIENMPWRDGQKRMAMAATIAAVAIACIFFFNAT